MTAQAAQFRANEVLVSALIAEAEQEYTSKSRLRVVALSALHTLRTLYSHASSEASAEQAADSGLILPPEGIVTP